MKGTFKDICQAGESTQCGFITQRTIIVSLVLTVYLIVNYHFNNKIQ